MAVRMEHIVVEQQHIGHGVGIGVAAEFVVGGKSWYTMVVKTTDGVETVGGGSS